MPLGAAGAPRVIARWIFAAVHLLALGVGLGSVWARGRALRGALDPPGIRRVLYADTWWGVAAALWIGTGLVRAFGGLEKGSGYYLSNHFFLAKMALLAVVLLLELSPMVAFTRWRGLIRRGAPVDTASVRRFARISDVEAVLVILMVLAATAMARGLGARAG
jgi:putative membrane protein